MPFRQAPSTGGGARNPGGLRDFKHSPSHGSPGRELPRPPRSQHGGVLFLPERSTFGDSQVSVTVEQTQPNPIATPDKATLKKFYVPPRWAQTEHGVEVLVPGFWTDKPELEPRDKSEKPPALK
jgi:hypothetical protein